MQLPNLKKIHFRQISYIAFFIIDFLAFSLISKWMLHSLLTKLSFDVFDNGKKLPSISNFIIPMCLLALQDFFLFGRFGLSLVAVVPVICASIALRKNIICLQPLFALLFLSITLFTSDIALKALILGKNVYPMVTLLKIFGNMVAGYLALLGVSGSRSFFVKSKYERKVWTPNRMGAS